MPIPNPKMFITCWAQPPENFSIWKADGVNVVIGPEVGNPVRFTQFQVHEKVRALDLYYIDVPQNKVELERMVSDPFCLAISLPDEPDLHIEPYNKDVAKFNTQVAAWIGKYDWIVKTNAGRKRMYINFAGPKVLGGTEWGYKGQQQQPFVDLIKSIPLKPGVYPNILSCDYYPANQNRARYKDTFPGDCVRFMKQWWPGFEYWSYLECSDQVLDGTIIPGDLKNIGRAPTPQEVEDQLAGLLAQGVTGISWFSHKFKGEAWQPDLLVDAWDGRSPELRLKCKEIAQRFSSLPIETPSLEARLKTMETRNDEIMKKLASLEETVHHLVNHVEDLEKKAVTDIQLIRGKST